MFRRIRSRASRFPIVQFDLCRLSIRFLNKRRIQPLPLNQITDGDDRRDVESGELRQPIDRQRIVSNTQLGLRPGRLPNLEGMMSEVAEHSQVAPRGTPREKAEHSVVDESDFGQARDQQDHIDEREGQILPENDQNLNQARQNEGVGGEIANGELEQPNAEQEIQTFAVPTYLQAHFEMMYLLGLSPVNGSGEMGPPEQQVLFVLIFGMGLFDALGGCKDTIVEDMKPGELFQYITVLFLMGIVLLQLYSARLVSLDYGCIARILRQKMDNDDSQSVVVRKKPKNKISSRSTAYFFIVLLTSLAGAIRVDWLMIEGDSPSVMILSRSRLVSEHLYYWHQGPNGTDPKEELRKQYGTEISPTTAAMGAFGIGSVFVNYLQGHLGRDILLATALHTHRMTQIFHSSVLKILRDTTNVADIIPKLRKIHDRFVGMSDEIEFGFGNFFKVVHLQNWLFCSYILLDVLLGYMDGLYFVQAGCLISKILLAYYIAAKAFSMTQATKNYIEKHFERNVSDPIEKTKIKLFLKTVKRRPIGIGRGQFLLDESFGSKFVCVVISCFLMFADSETKK